MTVPAEADKRKSEPDKKPGGSAAPSAKRKQPLPRGAKWAIVLLSVLCVLLLLALLEVAFLPRLIERDVNSLLQRMAGDAVEFRIKTISLTSAEVACKVKDTARNGRPLKVGSIGSLSIRYSPLPLLRDRTIESIDIENCDVVADYSDGSISIPAWDIFAEKFQSGEKKKKDDSASSAPVDDLNTVVPVRIGRITLSGSLAAVARGEDAVDTLHIPYAVTVRPDNDGLGWNKIECSLMVHFATNGVRCRATYMHKEKKVSLELDDFSLATSALPGTIRSGLPRGLRAGIALKSKAEIDLNSLTLEGLENSSFELEGDLTLGYRMQQGFRIDSSAPFTLKTVPRVIPTVKPMDPPKTEKILVFTLGSLKGEYDAIPFELGEIMASVSLRHRTLQGGFRLTVADSEPAQFSFGGELDGENKVFELNLDNKPVFKANYKGANATIRPDSFRGSFRMDEGGIAVSGDLSAQDPQVDFDGAGLNPELKGLTASLKPDSFSAHFGMSGGVTEVNAELKGGEIRAGFKGADATVRPDSFRGSFRMDDAMKVISADLTGGTISAKKDGMTASFVPETFSANLAMADRIKGVTAELKGKDFNAGLNGMTCEAKSFSIGAVSDTVANVRDFGTLGADADDAKSYRADAKITEFQFKQLAAGLAYVAPELGLNAAFDLGSGILSGEAICEDSKLTMPELKLLAKNLKWDFPFDYTLAKSEPDDAGKAEAAAAAEPRAGRVSLGDFEFNGIQAASLDGSILWDDAAKALRLKTDARLFSINGQIYADIVLGADGVETECGITIPEQDADLSKDLVAFFPQFEEISCTGKLGGSAVYKLLPKTTTGHAEFRIADADVLIPEKKLEIHGIDLGFEIPEIAVMKSAPGQTLSFRSVKFDKIETGAGKFSFRMEAPDTWQIENAQLDWCNGHIRLGGITYRPGQTTTEAVLYCDRLDLPLFLTQIGLGQINGSGAINGTIPVVITQKSGQKLPDNIYFEDAFLFSTPGEDGVIKGEIDESIMSSEGGVEMELAKDALKDFSYSWVRLSMLSTGRDKGDLKLSLQLDGRPNRALYYAFDENTASFVKSATPCIFQGIRLDTNVNIESGKALELVDYLKDIFSGGN